MTALMLDSQPVARADVGAATVNSCTSATRARARRDRLACRWQRSPEGLLTCAWTQVSPQTVIHPAWLTDTRRENGSACARQRKHQLRALLPWIAIAAILAGTVLVPAALSRSEASARAETTLTMGAERPARSAPAPKVANRQTSSDVESDFGVPAAVGRPAMENP